MPLTIWNRRIHSFVRKLHEVEMPRGAEILCAREQGDAVTIWFRCDSDAPPEVRRIITHLTGEHGAPDSPDARYISTAILHGGTFVVHVFEAITPQR